MGLHRQPGGANERTILDRGIYAGDGGRDADPRADRLAGGIDDRQGWRAVDLAPMARSRR
jgi:hypothetical protein